MLILAKLVTKLLNCRTVISCCNNFVTSLHNEQHCSKSAADLQQLVNKLGTSSANTSC